MNSGGLPPVRALDLRAASGRMFNGGFVPSQFDAGDSAEKAERKKAPVSRNFHWAGRFALLAVTPRREEDAYILNSS